MGWVQVRKIIIAVPCGMAKCTLCASSIRQNLAARQGRNRATFANAYRCTLFGFANVRVALSVTCVMSVSDGVGMWVDAPPPRSAGDGPHLDG